MKPKEEITAEQILDVHGCPSIPFNENVTMYYPAILDAMEEYAKAYHSKQLEKVEGLMSEEEILDFATDIEVEQPLVKYDVSVGFMRGAKQMKEKAQKVIAKERERYNTLLAMSEITEEDTSREISDLKGQVENLKGCLGVLCDLKRYKEDKGKDEYYKSEQPLAWIKANELIEKLNSK